MRHRCAVKGARQGLGLGAHPFQSVKQGVDVAQRHEVAGKVYGRYQAVVAEGHRDGELPGPALELATRTGYRYVGLL